LDEGGKLPFPDDFFDIVFCSSAIEHVTVSKKRLRQYRTNQEFYKASYQRQVGFAEELRRVGKRYFVQTPYKYFLIESHTWMPGIIVLFPRIWQIKLIDFLNKWWPKKASPDWHLLTKKQMQALFPDAKIIFEKSFGLPKSLLAIKYTESN
jgi:hypothetical protein